MAYVKADDEQEQEYFDYLEELRQSGETNMFGARPYLIREFGLRDKVAAAILMRWMKAHDGGIRRIGQ